MAGYLVPGRAAIMRYVNAAARSAAVQVPGFDVHLPHAREQRLRVMRIHGKLGAPSVLINEQHLLPTLAAVRRFEDAALALRAVRLANCAGENGIRVVWINDDASNVARLLQAHAAPRPA